jgi:caffeoyl-CoA O-methyltransferase
MSEISSLVSVQHFTYIAERTTQEDAFLRDLKTNARAAGIPSIWVSPEQASFIQILLKLCGAREVVEVGTLAGYSAIWMARALPATGSVRTVEVSGKHADFAEQWISRSDVAERIKVVRGAGKDVLPKFESDSADAIFLDADKASYPLYLKQALRIVRRGGLVLADNAFAFGGLFDEDDSDADVVAVREFNEIMARETALQSIIIPIGDGLWVGTKL